MADATVIKPAYKSLDAAPIIYFDIVPAFGVMEGALQIELAGRAITPMSEGSGTIIEFLTTARIRCSPAAALQLRDSIDKALAMLQQPQQAPAGTAIN